MKTLVEKLREFGPQMGHYGAWVGGELMMQAADEIESNHKQILSLQAKVPPRHDVAVARVREG